MFCVSVKIKLTVRLLCVCVHFAWKGCPRNDLYCVRRDVKPYSLTHSAGIEKASSVTNVICSDRWNRLDSSTICMNCGC